METPTRLLRPVLVLGMGFGGRMVLEAWGHIQQCSVVEEGSKKIQSAPEMSI